MAIRGLAGVRDRIELIVTDMRRVEPAHLTGVDAIINVGGLSNDPTAEYNPTANYEMNTRRRCAWRARPRRRRAALRLWHPPARSTISATRRTISDVVFDETAAVRPRAAYATSKYEAEQRLFAMAGPDFCPVILRKGTVFGFSPRLRFDLVVNTFVRDALSSGSITLFRGGEMWRPLVDVHDVARAYIACVAADEATVHGQIFNVAACNMRISELALRVRTALRELDVAVGYPAGLHLPRCAQLPGFDPQDRSACWVSRRWCRSKSRARSSRADPPVARPENLTIRQYENLRWLRLLEEAEAILGSGRSVFDAPEEAATSRLAVASGRRGQRQ